MKVIIDVARYQTVSDWKKVAESVDGVFIKATEGQGYVDPSFKKHALGAQACGIPKGFYHFASLNDTANPEADARAEARDFLKATKPYSKELPLALDIETNKSALKPAQVLLWIESFFDELKKNGVTDFVLYSYASFLNTHLPKNHTLGSKYRLWLAAYIPKPILPKGWNSYYLWQYSSKGTIPGIKEKVDLNKKP